MEHVDLGFALRLFFFFFLVMRLGHETFFVESERNVGGRGGVRHHALHLEELLTCNTAGNHCAATKIVTVNISLKTF